MLVRVRLRPAVCMRRAASWECAGQRRQVRAMSEMGYLRSVVGVVHCCHIRVTEYTHKCRLELRRTEKEGDRRAGSGGDDRRREAPGVKSVIGVVGFINLFPIPICGGQVAQPQGCLHVLNSRRYKAGEQAASRSPHTLQLIPIYQQSSWWHLRRRPTRNGLVLLPLPQNMLR